MSSKRKADAEILAALEADPDELMYRQIGVWSLEKLAILHLYFNGFTTASHEAKGGVYIDGLAGPGICEVRGAVARPRYVWGSPMIALRSDPPFETCFFVEHRTSVARALEGRCGRFGGQAVVTVGDVNDVLPSLVRDRVHPRAPCFCLLDPEGMELKWNTVRDAALAPGRPRMPELLILFPSSWLLRLLPRQGVVSHRHTEILDEVMPSPRWRDIYEERLVGEITPAAAKEGYVEMYRRGLEDLGYTAFSHAVEAPSKPGGIRRERYRLIFATQHPAGEKIMTAVFKRPYVLDFPVRPQLPLFD